ncbi:MAG: aspartyl protease family protein [Blastocatellales bacterium]
MKIKNHRLLLGAMSLTLGVSLYSQAQPADKGVVTPKALQATVPLFLENNRPHIDLVFTRPDGSTRKARFILDTGGGAFILAESLANDIGLKPTGPEAKEEGSRFAPTKVSSARVGDMELNLNNARSVIVLGQKSILTGDPAEGMMPGHLLARYHVIFDYPAKKFTLAQPEILKPRGARVASPIGKNSGFPRIELQIDGANYGFLLDTGATFTMISIEALNAWGAKHTGWRRATGAVGGANMMGGAMENAATMMRLPEMRWAEFQLKGVAAVSRPKGTFETYMSQMMAQPIIGALGGNALRAFRIEIDYANGVTYLEKTGSLEQNDLDIVGLTLRPSREGGYVISAVSKLATGSLVDSVREGDKLISVGNLQVTGAPLAEVIKALRGKIGSKKTLTLERDGKRITLQAVVARIV